MNSWCESCARKNCCYTMEIRPKCYVGTTNTASGTPESYLAKSLRYSRDSHEIAKDEPQTKYPCETCANNGDYDGECRNCVVDSEVIRWKRPSHYKPKDKPATQTETQNSNLTFEKRTMRDCYNCKRYETEGECVECHYEPRDEPQTERSSE